jgi:hypothetical protein
LPIPTLVESKTIFTRACSFLSGDSRHARRTQHYG